MQKSNGTPNDGDAANASELAHFLPHAIQPHGCLIIFDDALKKVVQISANSEEFLGYPVETALIMTGAELLGTPVAVQLLQSLAGEERLGGAMSVQLTVQSVIRRYHLDAYRAAKRIVVEIEYASDKAASRLLSTLNQCLAEVTSADDENSLHQSLVEGFQTLAGYDQVYLVQFQADGSALVLAESDLNPDRSFLGGRFAAPAFSRLLRGRLRRNPLRGVPDLNFKPVPLLPSRPQEESGEHLIPGMLQAPSPDVCRFLQDLGARDVLAAALFSDSSLWGMVIGHHAKPSKKTPARRNAARALVQAATQRLFLLKARERMTFWQQIDASRIVLSTDLDMSRSFGSLLAQYGGEWMSVFQADGVGLVLGTDIELLGKTLPQDDVVSLTKALPRLMAGRATWQTKAFGEEPGLTSSDGGTGIGGVLVAALPSCEIKHAWIILFRKARVLTLFWIDPQQGPDNEQSDQPLGTISGVPVWRQRVLGQSAPWRTQERSAIRDIAEDLSVAVAAQAIRDLNERLETQANTDPLTNTHNRRSMEGILYREIETADRHRTPVTALLLDIDHFKTVNDTYGHELGDVALIEFAKCIGSHLRISDQLARWGGEEFLVLAPHTDHNQAQVLANRICSAVAALNIEVIGRLTTSIGIAEWQYGQTITELISRADRAMYQAKAKGRNQVVTSSECGKI